MSTASNEWLPVLAARSMLLSSVSDVLTSELLDGAPPPRATPPTLRPPQHTPQRLDVETDLSVLIAVSIPYYDLPAYAHSLDTVEMLQLPGGEGDSNRTSNDADTTAPYGNTSHMAHRADADVHAAHFNQVPPRFSQFILEHGAALAALAPLVRLPRLQKSALVRRTRSRDILDLMGSQATIFSTRANGEGRPLKRRGLRRRATKAGVDLSAEAAPAKQSLLRRRAAIRFKEGGALYRLRVRVRRALARVRSRAGRWWRTVRGLAKATLRVERPQARARGGPISAPLANPELGRAGAARVEGLTDELKMMAGGGGAPARRVDLGRQGKLTHLSQYLDEQHRTAPRSAAAFLVDSLAPPVPPHAAGLLFRQHLREETPGAEEVQRVWRQYLANVLALRIKLRQEIGLFQAVLAGLSVPAWAQLDRAGSIASSLLGSTTQHTLKAASVATAESIETVLAADFDSDRDTIDNDVHTLQRMLNRRSMLGEMLDYDSDEQSVASSASNGSAGASSVLDAGKVQRYGTVKRYHNTSSHYLSSMYLENSGPVLAGLIPRSRGYALGLHTAA